MDAWIAISWIGAKGLIDLWQAGFRPGFRPGNPVLPSMGRFGILTYMDGGSFYGLHVGKYTSTHGRYGVGWSLNVGWDGHTLVLRWMLPF